MSLPGVPRRLLAGLEGIGDVVVDADVLESYRRDQAAPGLLPAGMPGALVRPRTTAEVQSVVRACAECRVPIVPRGAGSGLSGGANATDGCVVVSLERMDSLLAVDAGSLTARVQPGVINDVLRTEAAQSGLWYPPDPASAAFSTLGGNIATNAGGLCCVKYGVTRDAVLGLEVVLADGRAVRLGRSTRKGVAGYDLTALIVGSEGTLAIVTEATVRLQPQPGSAATMVAIFPSLGGAGEAVAAVMRETVPSLLEIMDATTVRAVEALQPMELDLDAAAYLFARSDAGDDRSVQEVERMAELCERAGASLVVISDEEAEGRMIMGARRLAYPALERQGATLLDDVCVPLAAIPHLLDGIASIALRHEVVVGTFGHAGDGNMHPTIVYDPADAGAARAAQQAFHDILNLALDLGGTVTGEHGVGALKLASVATELGSSADLHRAIKRALDPRGILNPGKGIPDAD